MNSLFLTLVIIVYLVVLFYMAYWGEKRQHTKTMRSPYIYTLSLAVYTSAWTYYGSVGVAAHSGLHFLPIYLGIVIAAPLWIVVMQKIIRISKKNKVSSIADFISLRYGKHRFLGALVTLVSVIGIVPYIALQLKAISETFEIMTSGYTPNTSAIYNDATFYIAILLALFISFYGTQRSDASEKHPGIIISIAFESVLKLSFFLIIGVYITFFLFDSPAEIYTKMSEFDDFEKLTTLSGLKDSFNWFYTIVLSFFAIFLLPRQFHVAVVENNSEKDLKQAIWLFPLYLLLFNIFTIYIAWGGRLTLGNNVNADYYALLIPLAQNNIGLALMVFIGGFSAVMSMVVISTLALSTMVSNNLVIPYGFLKRFIHNPSDQNLLYIKRIRRVAIFLIIVFSYLFYLSFSVNVSLYSIGLVAFVVLAQLAPSFFGGLYWNRGSSLGAIAGIIAGMLVTFYTLISPFVIETFSNSHELVQNGPWGIKILRPYALLGIDFLNPPIHAFFWSITANVGAYVFFSLAFVHDYRERNYAEMFVDESYFSSFEDGGFIWKGEAYVADIKNVLTRFLGEKKASEALSDFFERYNLPADTKKADARLINYSEKILSGSIGNASAQILIAGVVKEEHISLPEILEIIEESKLTMARNQSLRQKSEELTRMSKQLRQANRALMQQDKQKNEFLDTVAHELKTPLSGIRAAAELIADEQDMDAEDRARFMQVILHDSDRLARLINNILDFEKISSGRQRKVVLEKNDIKLTIQKAIDSIQQIAFNKNIKITVKNIPNIIMEYDEDRIIQVVTNLLSNALKFCDPQKGRINICAQKQNEHVVVHIENNGTPIPAEDIEFIFDKFYQTSNQNIRKPTGSGLGLAISKHIVESHGGQISAEPNRKFGALFTFKLPINQKNNHNE